MKYLLNCLLLLACLSLHAQNVNLSPEVVATAGDSQSNGTLNVDWTLGEIAVESFAGTIVLTQGFHQPTVQTTSIEDFASRFGTIKVYPNPTASTISIEREKSGNLQLTLLDLKGSTLLQTDLNTMTSTLDLSHFPSGIYVLRLSDGTHAAQSLKIEKR